MDRIKTNITGIVLIVLIILGLIFVFYQKDQGRNNNNSETSQTKTIDTSSEEIEPEKIQENEKEKDDDNPMAIEALRQGEYSGGDFIIERTLLNGSNYQQYVASYQSEGLKINGLLTVPLGEKPEEGFPAIVFVHGYIPPKQYSTTGSYPSYQATLARGGFVTFKPDLRGHDESEGEPVSAHFSEKYIIDTLNAIAYLKDYKEVNPEKIGYWGHSNGGEIGLRVAVVSKDVKAYSFWAGVVGSYQDQFETYNEKIPFLEESNPLIEEYGLPSQNSEFWKQTDPYFFLNDISSPIQLQHATGDESVPVELSLSLRDKLQEDEKTVEYIEYQGDDHNIANNSALAWRKTIDFFKSNL